jgi:hypothetical protein
MTSRKNFLLRINAELFDALEAWAHQELRSVNGQMEYILKDAVAKHHRAVKEDVPEQNALSMDNRPRPDDC